MIGASSAGSSTGCVKAVDGVRFRMNMGPYMMVFNRYNRWSQRGLWQRLFAALSNAPILPRSP